MTAPRWIAEALAAECEMRRNEGAPDHDQIATALIERLPMEAMTAAIRGRIAGVGGITGDWIGAIAGLAAAGATHVLTDGDPEIVQLTELYQGACRALDEAGVPYAIGTVLAPPDVLAHLPEQPVHMSLDLAGRIRWLAQQRPTRIELRRVEAERDQLRKMLEGASADLDRERREHQEAEAAAANRELALTVDMETARRASQELKEAAVERNTAIRALVESDMPAGDLRRALADLIGLDLVARARMVFAAETDRQVLRAKVADQAAYIDQLELEIEALEDQIDHLDSNPDLPDMWTGCKVGAP